MRLSGNGIRKAHYLKIILFIKDKVIIKIHERLFIDQSSSYWWDILYFYRDFQNSSADFISLEISARADEVLFPTNILGGLCSCHRVALFLRSCLVGFFGLLLVSKGPLFSCVSKILVGTAPRLREMSWEVLSLTYCLVVQWQRSSLGISYFIYDRLNLVAVFLHNYVEEERIK